MSTITVTLTDTQLNDLKRRYPTAEYMKTPQFALFQFRLSDCVVTAYVSKKVVFQGEGAQLHASGYMSDDTKIVQRNQNKVNSNFSNETYPQCGSDEVGTGDYFGPITVCAACVKEEDVAFLRELHITDSKVVSDKNIRVMGPQLMNRLQHSILILNNRKYNEIHKRSNMVEIKAKLHNQAFVHLKHKLGNLPKHTIIDQFTSETSYYKYVNKEKEVIRDIHFETKAESKYLAVASASIIARYVFLISFDAMIEQYHFPFLKGAGPTVDKNIKEFLTFYETKELQNVAKLHFANTKKIGVKI